MLRGADKPPQDRRHSKMIKFFSRRRVFVAEMCEKTAENFGLLSNKCSCFYTATEGAGVTPGLRRRRERAERQRSLLREQYESNMRVLMDTSSSDDGKFSKI